MKFEEYDVKKDETSNIYLEDFIIKLENFLQNIYNS